MTCGNMNSLVTDGIHYNSLIENRLVLVNLSSETVIHAKVIQYITWASFNSLRTSDAYMRQ